MRPVAVVLLACDGHLVDLTARHGKVLLIGRQLAVAAACLAAEVRVALGAEDVRLATLVGGAARRIVGCAQVGVGHNLGHAARALRRLEGGRQPVGILRLLLLLPVVDGRVAMVRAFRLAPKHDLLHPPPRGLFLPHGLVQAARGRRLPLVLPMDVRTPPFHAPPHLGDVVRTQAQVRRPLRHLPSAAAAVDVAAVHDAVHLGAHVWRLRVRVAHPVVLVGRPRDRTPPRLAVVDVGRVARGTVRHETVADHRLLLGAEVGAVPIVPRRFRVVVRPRRPRHVLPPRPALMDVGGVALNQVAVPRAPLR